MNTQAGIWIDHKQAFIAFAGDGEGVRKTESGMEKHARFHRHSDDGTADDQRDRQFAAHLGTYYDEVIALVHDAQSILIFGPGEAKGELNKRFADKGQGTKIVGVETVDKMTVHQIAAKVREHFEK